LLHENKFFLGELFCGPGGMALGAKLAEPQIVDNVSYGIEHVWGVDKDPDAIRTYNANSLGEGVETDAIQFALGTSTIETKSIKDFKNINALAFGFPCNDFSLVGEQKGVHGKFGELYKAGILAIDHSNPYWFVAENVSGINSSNSGKTFKKILAELSTAGIYGYNLSVNLYKFEEYSVPQYRHRYIIVGFRKDLDLKFRVPKQTSFESFITALDAIAKPISTSDDMHIYTRQSSTVEDRLLFTPPWRNAWYLDELIKNSIIDIRLALKKDLPWYDTKIKLLSDRDLLNRIYSCKLHCEKAKMSHIYKRLDANRPSYTITGSGGGGTHVYHWEECRALTNRERARLQGFPDSFVFKGSKESIRKQIGMAVPPIGAKTIFEAILKTFAGVDYESVEDSYKFENYL
jgi:DNA (cytosine-5)-methyltransferase 1